jgi:hypothetical protein
MPTECVIVDLDPTSREPFLDAGREIYLWVGIERHLHQRPVLGAELVECDTESTSWPADLREFEELG